MTCLLATDDEAPTTTAEQRCDCVDVVPQNGSAVNGEVPHQGQKQCVIVKHTFLHVESVPDCTRGRSSSAPPMGRVDLEEPSEQMHRLEKWYQAEVDQDETFQAPQNEAPAEEAVRPTRALEVQLAPLLPDQVFVPPPVADQVPGQLQLPGGWGGNFHYQHPAYQVPPAPPQALGQGGNGRRGRRAPRRLRVGAPQVCRRVNRGQRCLAPNPQNGPCEHYFDSRASKFCARGFQCRFCHCH